MSGMSGGGGSYQKENVNFLTEGVVQFSSQIFFLSRLKFNKIFSGSEIIFGKYCFRVSNTTQLSNIKQYLANMPNSKSNL